MSEESKEETKTYESEIVVLMPGNQKPTTYRMNVSAVDPVEAMARAIDAWSAATEPRDIRVREVHKTP